ncbi:MAG: enoyl-CoA hydratase-related protein [Saprospiraceae bacterium]|nr:enoyl-CoA hydratase-related protein [Saprospiraceae bacterium]
MSNLQITWSDNIAIVTVSREKALNALNRQTMDELHEFFSVTAPATPGLKGVVITGAGEKSFVAGADITEFLGLSPAQGKELAQRGQDVFFLIERFDKPVVAAINGFALGGGCELAMACHLRIASEKARFGQPEVNLGLIPGYGGTQRLIQYIGKTKAMELLMTADMIGAEEAHRLGLVNYVVPAGEEVGKATELIEKIAAKAPVAISKIIAAVNAFYTDGVNGFDVEVSEFGNCCATEDFKEGASAFVEKRKADFKGR